MMQAAQGAMLLQIAFVGVANRLFEVLGEQALTPTELAQAAQRDPGYVVRWCDAAIAFVLLVEEGGRVALSNLGRRMLLEAPGTLAPMAIQTVLGGHMAERAATFMKSGERPGEKVLAERESILPLFGPMLERQFGPLFESVLLPGFDWLPEIAARGGVVADLGCGNGWYLRKIAQHHPGIRGLGLDGFDENIRQATGRAAAEGLGDRLEFRHGDVHDLKPDEPVAMLAMNRALHHVWDRKETLFPQIRDHLELGGWAVIWEPAWPGAERERLLQPRYRGMAFQNLAEHIQGNHFLTPDEIGFEFEQVGMQPRMLRFADGAEAVVAAQKV
ncbi:MAG: class I SAM-dependent methyltransferase [Alphaproteobacteria bacterium CG_4_10_14_0_2_um_filter_63_37]|nr:MAG: class I SAM-dependent methyltransferase [Alphaproteobacteria bacterium CG_4_10_14_0_2_um_filter_63_37]